VAGSDDRQWLIQCKREKKIPPKKLVSYLNEIPEEERKKLHGIIFVAACDFSQKAYDAFRDWCARYAINEAYLWGKAQIEDILYQPKNDGLLFAYFGISLQIRKRSVRTALRARLSMKRKSERILSDNPNAHDPILLRDPSDNRYPFKPDKEELEKNPIKWKVKFFCGHHPNGLKIQVRSFYAYIGDDNKSWDYIPSFNAGDVPGYNRWIDKDVYWETRNRIQAFWDKIPEKNRAWFNIEVLLLYEDIYDIDEKGDSIADFPHIYLDMSKNDGGSIESLQPTKGWAREIEPDPANRIKFFPDEFPEIENIEPEPVIVPD
jgi:hypothetical protein